MKERVSDTTNKIMSSSFIDKGPSIGWSYRHIYPRADSELVEEEIRTVEQLEHVRGRTKIAGKLLGEIRKFWQATLQ